MFNSIISPSLRHNFTPWIATSLPIMPFTIRMSSRQTLLAGAYINLIALSLTSAENIHRFRIVLYSIRKGLARRLNLSNNLHGFVVENVFLCVRKMERVQETTN
jgi:hypothetical protein